MVTMSVRKIEGGDGHDDGNNGGNVGENGSGGIIIMMTVLMIAG